MGEPPVNWQCPTCQRLLPRHVLLCPDCEQPDRHLSSVLVVSTDEVAGYTTAQVFGMVTGVCVQSRNLFSDAGSDLQSLVGGELVGGTKMVAVARETAQKRMEGEARQIGANGVVGARFENNSLGSGRSQSSAFVAYGTAVHLVKVEVSGDAGSA
jgi:uncharacterized protein YbjQ (UPF0145 family)